MASSSSKGSPSGRKRKAEAEERHMEAMEERLLHLTLEKQFLEERTRLLESEARDYRLKIKELMRDVRERTEERLVELIKCESFKLLEARLKELMDKEAGPSGSSGE
ncbi:hypothetical protein R1sor_018687 [Riccia sorocarpa]|uniref:Uncharacterized protein n=1 Tax=Riccia sorocarpa TaxID=122646 RepID=A0ABD3IAD9_9MARC